MAATEPQDAHAPMSRWSARDRLDVRLGLLSSVIQQTTGADAKAVAVLLVGGALVTLLATGVKQEEVAALSTQARTTVSLLGATAIVATCGALLFALVALIPRLTLGAKDRRPLFFAHAARLETREYQAAFQALEADDDALLLALDVEYLRASRVAVRKHMALRWSVSLLAAAVLFLGSVLLFTPGQAARRPVPADEQVKVKADSLIGRDSTNQAVVPSGRGPLGK